MEKMTSKLNILKMKFLFSFIALLILLLANLIILTSISATSVAAADLEIALESYSPRPTTPGNFFTANFRADNTAGKNLTEIVLEIDDQNPFFVEGNNKINIPTLTKSESRSFSFLIGVKGTASSGFEDLDVEWLTSSDKGEETFSIQVKAIETGLVVESVESFPSEIAPGQEGSVKIRLKNNAHIQLRNIKVKLNLLSAELPFAPVGSVTERTIDKIEGQGIKEVDFKIVALADSTSRVYKIPLEITYFDEFAQEFKINDVVALVVSSKPSFDFNVESKLVNDRIGKVNIEIINKGLSGAKFLNVKVSPLSTFEIVGSSNIYIGDLDSDDTETITFELLARQESITLPLQVTYRDSNNKFFTETFNIQPKVYSVQEAKKLGIIKSNSILFAVLIIIFILVLYFIIRKIRKKREYKE